jgi:hypothetical protein
MIKAAEQAVEHAGKATEAFRNQAETLKKSSELALSQINAIEDKKAEARRDTFLRSATYVVDKLNQLAIDLNRVLETDIPRSVWKAFYDGDKTAFTKRLLGTPAIRDLQRIRQKFETDTDFRSYVSRFVNEFEALLEQTRKWDYDNLIAQAFLGADIGRLYALLCRALERQMK